MLKERKLKHNYILGGNYYGYCKIEGYAGYIRGAIDDKSIIKEINNDEYYFAEIKTSASDSDYHTFCYEYDFEGVFLSFNLNFVDTLKYFGEDLSNELFPNRELIDLVEELLNKNNMVKKDDEHDVDIENNCLKVTLPNKKLDTQTLNCCQNILTEIRNYYDKKGVHITRMFGSYILLKKMNGELKAIKATPIPIKYCPLMIKLLKEVGGYLAETLMNSLTSNDEKVQTENMCKLINEVVIKSGYFDTSRPLNSCEANVTFGASETLFSAFANNLIDAAVIVSNNLGTIITTNSSNTQGSVKRMTGLFYTSPSEELVNTAFQEGIVPVFPYTAEIDQLEGVRKAIELGYKNIAVTVAANDNYLLEEIKKLEKDNIKIYKFGLCSTGISKETAMIMQNNADVIWSCASKYVKELIEPAAIAQVGVKIPVHIMNQQGWEIIYNHLLMMNGNGFDAKLAQGDEKPIILNKDQSLKLIKRKEMNNCSDCPHPCI